MATGKVVLLLAVFAAVGAILLGPVNSAVAANTGTVDVTNETHAVSFGERIDLRGYNVDVGSETVFGFNETSGSFEEAPGSDYTLHGSGDITLNSSSTLFDTGEDFKISYTFRATDELTAFVAGFAPLGVALVLFTFIGMNVGGLT